MLNALMLLFFLNFNSGPASAGTVYTTRPLPEPFSYTRCETMLGNPERKALSQQFEPTYKLGKCHLNADVTNDTLSLFSISDRTTNISPGFEKIGNEEVFKLMDEKGKTFWQIPIPGSRAYRARPNISPLLEQNYANNFYDFVVLKETPHIRLFLGTITQGPGALYSVGLDVPCEHVAKFLADPPITAREYSVMDKDGRSMCRIPVMHFYRLLPSSP